MTKEFIVIVDENNQLAGSIINQQSYMEKYNVESGNFNHISIPSGCKAIEVSSQELNEMQLSTAKEKKIKSLIEKRDFIFGKLLFYSTIDGVDYYLKPSPQENIFLASHSMADGSTKDWYVYDVNGNKLNVSLPISKNDLISISNHYETRKTNAYNLCNAAFFDISNLQTLEEVNAFDIESVFVPN